MFQFSSKADLAIFHDFRKPPYGGTNQFIIALENQIIELGFKVSRNKMKLSAKSFLLNAYFLDFKKFQNKLNKIKSHNINIVHRVDGPISVYRGNNEDDTDKKIWQINHDLADKTIFQSYYSLNKHIELGLNFKEPTVIYNAVDPDIFNNKNRISFPDSKRKIKLIASSWSDNPRKGTPFYKWLEEHLDWSKYDFSFLGRTQIEFDKIKVIKPLPSLGVAEVLNQHDIYITASQDDPCSNSVLEALACGLPVAYLNSGGHPEIVGTGGKAFNSNEEALLVIDEISSNLEKYQNSITVNSIRDIALMYLNVMGLVE